MTLSVPAAEPQPVRPGELMSGVGLGSGPMVSPDNRWLIFGNSRGMMLMDRQSGTRTDISDEWRVEQGQWSPRATTLALDARREGRNVLNLWSPAANQTRELLVCPRRLACGSWTWAPDGKTIFFVVLQDLPWVKSRPEDDDPPTHGNNVTLELGKGYRAETSFERYVKEYPQAYAESMRSLVMAMDVASGRIGLVARGNDTAGYLYPSPDGRRLAMVQVKSGLPEGKGAVWTKQMLSDVYLVDVPQMAQLAAVDLESLEDRKAGWSDHRGRRLAPVLRDAHLCRPGDFITGNRDKGTWNPLLVWSPDSAGFAYATTGRQADGDVYLYSVASGQARNLTSGVTLADSGKSLGYGENYTWAHTSRKFGGVYPPLWLPDGRALLAVGRGDVWRIPVDGAQAPRNLTAELPQEARYLLSAFDAQGRVALVAKERLSRLDSVWKLDPESGESVRLADTGAWIGVRAQAIDARGNDFYYAGFSGYAAHNLYQLSLSRPSSPLPLTRYKPELADRAYPASRLVQWRRTDGGTGYGWLFLPAGASPERKAPMILRAYPSDPDSQLDVRASKGVYFFADEELSGLLRAGIAVFRPDVQLSDEGEYQRPMWQIVEGVNAATDAALATGLIDAGRLGIQGGSYGGFMVNAVITQTNRFKAAVSVAGLSDWVADFVGGGGGPVYHMTGQGRMEKALWDDPQRYVENSPISYWNKVRTPLLILHGEEDGTVPIRHAWESFNGLNYLERPAIFARYRRESHSIGPEGERRIVGWFREHLMGGPPITQLAEQGSFFFGDNSDKAALPQARTPEPAVPATGSPPAPTQP